MRVPTGIKRVSRERQGQVLQNLARDSSPGFDFFFLVVLSCSIATFGLIADSVAIIIGAMLVAPLMSPILGFSLASVVGQRRMFRQSLLAVLEGAALAIALSALWASLARAAPFGVLNELPHEVLARTRPSPFDLGVALAGGIAVAYALTQPYLSAALPGVAIATALMPPLCTVGIGIATYRTDVALGALLLFFTNLAAISFGGIVVFIWLDFQPATPRARQQLPLALIVSLALVLLITIPLTIFTIRYASETRQTQEVRAAVAAEVALLPDAQLVSMTSTSEGAVLHLLVTVRTSRAPDYAQSVALQTGIASRLQRATALELIIVPITRLNPFVPLTRTPTPRATPTATRGPSPTPSATPTHSPAATPTATATATLTPTNTPTATATATFAPTSTPTPQPTPTVVLAVIANTGGDGLLLLDAPAGRIIGALPEGSAVQLLAGRKNAAGRDWIEVLTAQGQHGWMAAEYLRVQP